MRKGDWMQTYTGRRFWPVDPLPSEIHIEDIAHSLSMQCRYGGHVRRFYSVAEHSVHLARAVAPEHALWALLHDASEAYLVDIPRPVKGELSEYKRIEAVVMSAVAHRFGLAHIAMPDAVKEADNRILVDEHRQAMAPGLEWASDELEPLGIRCQFWEPFAARTIFLAEFERLRGRC
jgi:uncharacterized protein